MGATLAGVFLSIFMPLPVSFAADRYGPRQVDPGLARDRAEVRVVLPRAGTSRRRATVDHDRMASDPI